MKRAAIYLRVSTIDQHPETQWHDLEQMAAQRGYQVVKKYTDRISGAKARRPGLDETHAGCPPRPIRCRVGLGLGPHRPVGETLP